MRGRVGDERSSPTAKRLVEVALIAAGRDLAVHWHFAVGVDLRDYLVVDGIRDQRTLVMLDRPNPKTPVELSLMVTPCGSAITAP